MCHLAALPLRQDELLNENQFEEEEISCHPTDLSFSKSKTQLVLTPRKQRSWTDQAFSPRSISTACFTEEETCQLSDNSQYEDHEMQSHGHRPRLPIFLEMTSEVSPEKEIESEEESTERSEELNEEEDKQLKGSL